MLLHALMALSLVVLLLVSGLEFGRISDGHLCSPFVPLPIENLAGNNMGAEQRFVKPCY